MTRTRLVLGLALAVLVAGCTQVPGLPGEGDGPDVTITPEDGLTVALEPSSRSIRNGDGLVVELDVENTGQHDAGIEAATLFGSSIFDGCTADREPSQDQPITLNAALPDADQVGGQTRLGWTCESVSTALDSGESDAFPVGVETTYTYGTTARTSFTISRPDDTAAPSGQSSTNTAAPVHATIDVADPAVIESDDDQVSLPITVENVGDGEVAGDVSLSVATPQSPGTVTQCPGTVSLIDGSRDVLCRVSFSGSPPSSGTQIIVEVDLDYRYTERAETSVTVTG